MCGIAGYITKGDTDRPNEEKLRRMTDSIRHRGPDAEGWWNDNRVGFGHRRLAIIDLDAKSNQPMESHDGRFIITYNGEIYNYIELKRDLLAKGSMFRTNSDTEVIIEAYRHYGTECLNMFNGMWAFALYDRKCQKILFSRDRFGIKPLYTVDNAKVFIFASEVKAILAGFPEEAIPNDICIYRYLSFSAPEDIDKECFFRNVKIFPPAHYCIYDLTAQKKEYRRYWEINEELFRERWIAGNDPLQVFRDLFEDSVALRLRADVEVGACLSGGLDSSSIVGCASQKYGRRLHTFSSIYGDKDCNEEPYIRIVNKKWDSIAHYVKPDDEESHFTEHISRLTYHHDQPTGGPSLYSQYMVMRCIQGNVKVVLDGQGADELFAGYIPYYAYRIADLMEDGGFFSKCRAVNLLVTVKKEWPDVIGAISTDAIVRLVGLKNSFLFQNPTRFEEMKIKRGIALFTDDFVNSAHDTYQKKEIQLSSKLNTRLCNDVLSKSIPALLHNEDGNSMAFSIESRVPFLDYRIVEFALALDGKYKIKNQWTKWIVRKALRKYLPSEIANRKSKMGFPAPFSRWLRNGKSKDDLRDVIYQFEKRKIVSANTIDRYYKTHMENKANFSDILFRFYNMELWYRIMIDGRTAL